jgi:hypothetical protein
MNGSFRGSLRTYLGLRPSRRSHLSYKNVAGVRVCVHPCMAEHHLSKNLDEEAGNCLRVQAQPFYFCSIIYLHGEKGSRVLETCKWSINDVQSSDCFIHSASSDIRHDFSPNRSISDQSSICRTGPKVRPDVRSDFGTRLYGIALRNRGDSQD